MRSPSACTPRWAPTWAAPTTAISASRARSTASADAWSGSLVLVRVGLTAPNSYSSRSMNVRIPAALANSKNTGYMRLSEAVRRTGDAARATGGAFRSSARAGATATRRTGGLVHRVTGASGAGRTGLSTLIELTAAGGAADAFVAVSLAGTIFFSTSVDQARGRVVLFLLVTMAPFAVLAPFIGPALDRMQQGRR